MLNRLPPYCGYQRVNEHHLRVKVDQPARQVRADEAQAARYHHPLARVYALVRLRMGRCGPSSGGGSCQTPVFQMPTRPHDLAV